LPPLCLIVYEMIRTLLLAALVAVALCGPAVVDQAEWFGAPGRLGMGPFCDSQCLPNGAFTLRRDWRELESEMTKKFIYFVDGDISYWHDQLNQRSCGVLVNDFILSGNSDFEEEGSPYELTLKQCIPEIMYLFEFSVVYNHIRGQLVHNLYLKASYTNLTVVAWESFIDDYFNDGIGRIEDKRTKPWSLIRTFPSLEGARGTNVYDGDVYLQQTFIANYEKNFCTFTGSNVPVEEISYCDFQDDYDSEDFGSNFVSRDFCQWMIGDYGTHLLRNDCATVENTCNNLRVADDDDDNSRRRNIGERDHTRGFRSLMTAVQRGARPVEVPKEHVQKHLARAQYDPGEQAIPEFNDLNTNNWSDDWMNAVFYYVPYGSSITAPYCAYRYDNF